MRPGQGWAVCSLPRASRTSKDKRGEAVSWVATAAPSNKGAVINTAPHLSQQIPQGSDPLTEAWTAQEGFSLLIFFYPSPSSLH